MKKILVLLVPLFMAANASALFEARLGYGVNTPQEKDISSTAALSTMTGFNLDAIAELPMVPFGFGLRYESMGLDVNQGGATYNTDLTRLSLLLNYRIIDFFTYFGVIGTIGFANNATVKNVPLLGNQDYTADLTYTVGVEGGLSFGLLMVGAELGYTMATYEGNVPNATSLKLDGIYAKALAGVSF